MDLRQIEYFIRVAELGSFTRASIDLGIAQPALSRQVRLLEVELRQNLLLRNGRGVTLTEAGKMLLDHGRGIMHQIARTREELSRVRGSLVGKVAVGLPPSLSKVLTVPLIHAFKAHLPEASLSVTEGLSSSMVESLIAGRLDLALLYNAAPSPEIDLLPLAKEPLYLVQSARCLPDDELAVPLKELPNHPLITPSPNNAIRMFVESELAAVGLKPDIVLEIDSINAILDLVADGAGSAVLSIHAVNSLGAQHQLLARPIVDPCLHIKLYTACSARRPTTLTQKAVMDLMQQQVDLLFS